MPRISVIIATYNRANLLGRAIDSVLNQTFTDYELIVVDDGSTDDTLALVNKYGDAVKYLFQENQGKSVALNKALAIARGEWIALLDSDDYWLPEKLDWQVRAIDELNDQEVGACYTDGRFMNNAAMDTTVFKFYGRSYQKVIGLLPRQVETLAESSAGVSVVTLMFRADLVENAGVFDPDLRFTEDYDFVFRLALSTKYCFVNLPLVMIDRSAPAERHQGASSIWDSAEFRLKCEQYRCKKWLRLTGDRSAEVRTIIRRRLRCIHSARANLHLAQQRYSSARSELRVAAMYDITPALVVKWCFACVAPAAARSLVLKRQPENPELVF